MASQSKTIFAHTLSVGGDLNLGVTSTKDSPLEMLSFGIEDGVIDVIFRNRNRYSSLLHRAELLVDEVRPVPDRSGVHAYRTEATYEYHLLLNLGDRSYQLKLAQEIPAGGLDRFRIILGLARAGDHIWLFPPFMPREENMTCITHAYFRGAVTFYYDNDQTIVAPSQQFVLRAFQFGRAASTMPEMSYRRNLEMLKNRDVGVIARAVDALVQAEEPSALPSLKELRNEIGNRLAQDTTLTSAQWANLEKNLDDAITSIEIKSNSTKIEAPKNDGASNCTTLRPPIVNFRDGQAEVSFAITHHIEPADAPRAVATIGEPSRVLEVLKTHTISTVLAVLEPLSIEETRMRRSKLQQEIEQKLRTAFKPMGITLDSFSLNEISPK
jgi:SPFH domain / Band 7 family